jgi:DNA-binding NtrC family response regulator
VTPSRKILDPVEIARELARGELACRLFPDLGDEARARVAAVARACGERILDLEESRARLEDSLVDLRAALKSYAEVKSRLREENEAIQSATAKSAAEPLIGADAGLREVARLIEKIVDTPLPVLITGESGTGKEVVARHIHAHGPRAGGPLVAINCGALPEALLESELFGIEKGVATGVAERAGRFQHANGGTLFLDEVAEMTPATQVKVLRALNDHKVQRVGGQAAIAVDVRVISATNKDLKAEVAAGRFREDLYYRLLGVHIHLPPLRERRGDIDALLDHFLALSARQLNRRVAGFSVEARLALSRYAWPGNVRELAVEVQRAVAVAEGEVVGLLDLSPEVGAIGRAEPGGPLEIVERSRLLPLREFRDLYERAYLERVLARAGSQRRAAHLLGITSEGLRKRLRALGMGAAEDAAPAAADGAAPPA